MLGGSTSAWLRCVHVLGRRYSAVRGAQQVWGGCYTGLLSAATRPLHASGGGDCGGESICRPWFVPGWDACAAVEMIGAYFEV